ncbi:glutathione S-transferase T3-like [Raphanus sativus]|uniref:Glutathione S-transferase T3-like n=1 Tax=Raphanus sativus TaxID=3726 RepID=A0A9W3CHA5_RAPSA|nr:glutathione S-transferase T3-like [Raphanus sativus]
MASIRSQSYSIEEDKHLCHVYLDVSQNPIIGINQSGDQFWTRVQTEYEKSEISLTQPRPRRSLQTRMTTILSAVSKLRGCFNQIENKNPSGASEQDILNQAKMLLTQDVKYKKGFKFDHVWPILKGIENFSNNHSNRAIAFSEESRNAKSSSSNQDESSPSLGMNSFDLNLNSEESGGNLSKRPMGVKKAKKKQHSNEQFKQMMEQNDKLLKAMVKGTSERNEIKRQKVELQRKKHERKMLLADLSSITDPARRAYIENERAVILSKGVPTTQYEEHGEGSQSQYHGSQYRAYEAQRDQAQGDQAQGSQVQGQQPQDEDPKSPSEQQDFSQYYNLLSGDGNGFPGIY